MKQADGIQTKQTSASGTESVNVLCVSTLYTGCVEWTWFGHALLLGLGTAMCINLHADHMYLVGSEEGKIYKCSKAFKDHYLEVYHVR